MKFIKSRFFFFLLGIIISGSIVFATTKIAADQIEYAPNVSVKDKIDDLYTKVKPIYTDNTIVTPTSLPQTLYTSGKNLISNILINPIPSDYIDIHDTTITSASDIADGKVAYTADGTKLIGSNAAADSKKICKLYSGYTANAIGAKYECVVGYNNNTEIKKDFYILVINNDTVKLIMDRNITQGSATKTLPWSKKDTSFAIDAMTYIDNNLKATWTNVIDIDLPKAQDIANAVGNTGWKEEDKNYNGWFYFDPKNSTYGQTQVATSSKLSSYKWLYNYTRECSSYGCDSTTSLATGEAYGYWTRDIVAQPLDSTSRAWSVGRHGRLYYDTISTSTGYGVRPVITVLKSNLYISE